MKVGPPQFLGKLYRDMRDRRLLIPAAALIVALVAVPMLLKSNAAAPSPQGSIAGQGRAASATDPAVITEQVSATDYRKRLRDLESKNPFHQQHLGTPEGSKLNATGTGGSGTDVGGSSSDGSSDVATSPPLGDPGSTSPPVTSSPPSTSTPPSTGSGGGGGEPEPGFHLYTYRVAVKIGEPGQLEERPEVSALAILPSKGRPVLSFLEANGKQALFLVSTDVDSVKGEGRCYPRPKECQYILMRPGDKASFHYEPNNRRYNLVLVDIHAVEIGHKPPTKVSGNSAMEAKLPLLGTG